MKIPSFLQYPAAAVMAAVVPLLGVSCSSTTSATATAIDTTSSSATIGLDPYEREAAVKQSPLSDDPASPMHNMRAADNKVGLQIAEF